MTPVYLLVLLACSGCMLLADRRWRLAFWRDPRRATLVLLVGIVVLLASDFIGIGLGVFHRSTTWAMTGAQLAPELPVEEPVFLAFLVYLTMNLLAVFGRPTPGKAR